MKSMTGYGKGQTPAGPFTISVEISAVNHRQTDIRLDLPPGLGFMEHDLRRLVRSRISRGAVLCRIFAAAGRGQPPASAVLDEPAAAAVVAQARRLARRLRLADDLRASHLLAIPGLWAAAPDKLPPDILQSAIRRAVRQALSELDRMRLVEGRALAADLAARLRKISQAVGRLERLAPRAAARARRHLRGKIRAWAPDGAALTSSRLEREIAAAVMRSDIAEELTRLRSHLQQAEHCLRARKPVGRTLDFLLQEMFREINTAGAKVGDAASARLAVQAKTELERVREQAQNLE